MTCCTGRWAKHHAHQHIQIQGGTKSSPCHVHRLLLPLFLVSHGRPQPQRLRLRLLLTAATTTNFSTPSGSPPQPPPRARPMSPARTPTKGRISRPRGVGRWRRAGTSYRGRRTGGWCARVRVDAPLEAVGATLTDYEGLTSLIPDLFECRLHHQEASFARL